MKEHLKPEVGDVYWDSEANLKLVITFEKYDMFWGLWETGISFSCLTAINFNDKKRLGKSKANINDLFEVQDDTKSI